MKQPTLKPEMRLISVSELVPWGRNPRRHDLARIVASIKRFGFRAPLVVNRRDGQYIVEAGHGRLLAALKLGLTELPCVVVEDDEDTATAYALADNRLQELTEWDLPKLADILRGLDAELAEVAGWNEQDLAELLNWQPLPQAGLAPDDEVPEQVQPICQTGDLWQLGGHRLLCGDATKREDVERLMGGAKADMVFTDPPYGIGIVKVKGGVNSDQEKNIGLGSPNGPKPYGRVGGRHLVKPNLYPVIFGDDKPFDPQHLLGLAPIVIIFGGNYFASRLPDSKGWLVWDKNVSPESSFSDAELLWTNQNGHVRMYRHVWSGLVRQGSRRIESLKRLHPTQKPVGLLEQILGDFSKARTIVLDPYLGSGSMLIACERLGRLCFGLEIEPAYCDVIITRWQNFVGQQAVKVGSV